MKRLTRVFTVAAALAGLLAFGVGTYAAPSGGGGGGSSGGGGGGGGTPGGGGKEPPTDVVPDYGDLWILYRDSNGVPYVTIHDDNGTPDDASDDIGMCQQPIAFNEDADPGTGIDPDDCPDDCVVDSYPSGTDVVDVDQSLCAVRAGCSLCVHEVEFERDNVIRAKESVLAQQLEDATVKLATAGCISLDPAGRPVASSVADGLVVSSTIDSPIQNLGFYKKLSQDGYVGSGQGNIDLYAADWLDSAARAVGGSFAKENESEKLDMLIYMNQILGLTGPEPEEGQLPPSLLCDPCLEQTVREEVMGEIEFVTKYFLDYSGYEYGRYVNFSNLPYEAYIKAQDDFPQWPGEGPITDGLFEYALADNAGGSDYKTDLIFDAVFKGYDAGGVELVGFAQAADDTRAVINFMHGNPLDDMYVTPIPCGATTPDYYDLSISDVSGLKVPRVMAAAGDGREGMVYVHNAGPADATHVCVQLTGVFKAAGEEDQPVELWASLADMQSPEGERRFDPEVEDGCEYVDVTEGIDEVITFFFEMNVTTNGTITWTATVTGANEINDGNDTVIKTTRVKKPKGGGGGGDH